MSGLPEGQMGNSEVGHLNLGAGRIVYQDLTRINKAIRDGELATNPVLAGGVRQGARAAAAFHRARVAMAACIRIRIISSRWPAAAKAAGVEDIMVHAITDGRDTSPTGGADYLAQVEAGLAPTRGEDRDGHRPLLRDGSRQALGAQQARVGRDRARARRRCRTTRRARRCSAAYTAEPRGDEFLQPIIFSHANEQRVRDGDVVLWFNFRADRARQLSMAFMRPDFAGFEREVAAARSTT